MTVYRRTLAGSQKGQGQGAPILDSLTLDDAGQAKVQVYFGPGVTADQIDKAKFPGLADFRTIGGSLIVSLQGFGKPGVDILLSGENPVKIKPTLPETDLFAGQNTALVERNGETVQTVCDWLTWHAREHGLQGALIVDRGKPGQADKFARSLENKLGKNDDLHLTIVVLSSAIPLGKPGTGPESHPINAPDAPGKDRMSTPKPDPWSAPLGAPSLYELLRWRFLNTARAVMNIDMHDLIPAPQGTGKSVFDRAVEAPQGVVTLQGVRAYPWALRKGKPAGFGDHICVQFDSSQTHTRWCIAPGVAPEDVIWRMVRLTKAAADKTPVGFFRCMALRHRGGGKDAGKISKIVPKSSLVETPELLALAAALGHKPVRMPRESDGIADTSRVAIVTCMKNEGPFILEWLAYHRAIGVDDFLVYSNDCDDGTDTMLELLQSKGYLQHRDNPFRKSGLKPQHAALAASEDEPLVKNAGWLICMDVDEFINIHVGDGTLAALFAALPDANMISMTWRLFGNADVTGFKDELITSRYTSCAPHMTRKPHQAWGFKTLYRNIGLFKKMGVHRPKGLKSQLVDQIAWVNGSGALMPKKEYRNAWRSTTKTIGYDLVTLNHYSLRSAESFLVKRDRGRVNHVDRDQGLTYWFRMNNNAESDESIQRMLPLLRAEMDHLLSDPDIAAAHAHSVNRHRARIDELKQSEHYSAFFADLISPRLRGLSRQHLHFGSAVFHHGPDCIPKDFPEGELPADFLFTVPK
ncbi:MAG: glycosyltransferase family 2 protein [Rhodobacteraceae bacterium]|nr:glycosyltransferase family 2 protein [Paracoccaceae bacterium]